ncbi:MAG: ArnT family glycosyltransferase [Dehalococcoidia bacterium]
MTQSLPLAAPVARIARIRTALMTRPSERILAIASFVTVVGVAFGLYAWNLGDNGWGNTYYAAAVRSMTVSWKNFFFGAFDPGGFITVDKPPVFLWIGALSARIFGYSSWSILLPSACAGAATVGIVWWIVRRYFGLLPATAAGAALALSPINVAVDRLNLPEPFYVLALVGAVAMVLRSLESKHWWWWTIAAGVLVGISFNTKMMAAWIPGPALALALVVGDADSWRLSVRRVSGRLALLAAATFLVSASWMLAVDNWPGDRPYVGGSNDDSVYNLIVDYNGVGRVDGETAPPGGGARPGGGGAPGGGRPGANRVPPGPGGVNLPATGAGGIIAGSPGLTRLFDDANGPQIGWLLPFALLGSFLCLWVWRRDRLKRAAVVAALGWTVLFGLVFSYAEGIYHSYYTAAMTPGVAMLVGMTVAAGVGLSRRNPWWLAVFSALVLATAFLQVDLAGRFPEHLHGAVHVAVAVAFVGVIGILAAQWSRWRMLATPGLAVAVAALLVIPGAWSGYEAAHKSLNTTLPQAGPRAGAAGASFGSAPFDSGAASLAAWLQRHGEPGARWDLAVASAQSASTLIAEYGLSVMAIGGFSGQDPTIAASDFAALVEAGEIRYVVTTAAGPGGGGGRVDGGGGRPGVVPVPGAAPFPGTAPASTAAGSSAVFAAVQSVCTVVTGNDVPASYAGALYDCAGAAEELR